MAMVYKLAIEAQKRLPQLDGKALLAQVVEDVQCADDSIEDEAA